MLQYGERSLSTASILATATGNPPGPEGDGIGRGRHYPPPPPPTDPVLGDRKTPDEWLTDDSEEDPPQVCRKTDNAVSQSVV